MAIRGGSQQVEIGLDAEQGYEPCGCGGSNVGPHNHADSLAEVEQAGVGESDDHDGHGAG